MADDTDLSDWTSSITPSDYTLGDLNGSSAPNSSNIPLSTPIDTSGGNTNTSGNWFGSLINGLSGIGTTAAQAYTTIFGTKAQQTAAQAQKQQAAATSTLATTLKSLIVPALLVFGVLIIVVVLFRSRD
jgi:hypothetical protein